MSDFRKILSVLSGVFAVNREWNKRIAADQARQLFEKTGRQEREFLQYFTGEYAFKKCGGSFHCENEICFD